MTDPNDIDAVRVRSGDVRDARPIVSLLYILLRDGDVSPGRLEELLYRHVPLDRRECQFTNGWLAAYAKDVANRLEKQSSVLQALACLKASHTLAAIRCLEHALGDHTEKVSHPLCPMCEESPT